MTLGLGNAMFVLLNEIFFSFEQRMQYFFIYDLTRFTIMHLLCFL